jgi:hypothetical protein
MTERSTYCTGGCPSRMDSFDSVTIVRCSQRDGWNQDCGPGPQGEGIPMTILQEFIGHGSEALGGVGDLGGAVELIGSRREGIVLHRVALILPRIELTPCAPPCGQRKLILTLFEPEGRSASFRAPFDPFTEMSCTSLMRSWYVPPGTALMDALPSPVGGLEVDPQLVKSGQERCSGRRH